MIYIYYNITSIDKVNVVKSLRDIYIYNITSIDKVNVVKSLRDIYI